MSGDNSNHTPPSQLTLEEEVSTITDTEVADNPHPAPKSRRRFLVPALIVAALLGGVGWIVFNRVIYPIMVFSQMKPQFTEVEVSTPQATTINDSSEYPASLDSRQAVTLQPRVAGQVSAIYVKAGDRVEAGQQLLQMDAGEQQAQVASRAAAAETAAADIEAAKSDVANEIDTLRSLQARRASTQSNVQLNQREYDRYLDLYNQGATSRQVLDQRLNALQTAQADLQQADADVRAQQARINRARTNVERNRRALEQAQATVVEGQAQLKYYTITAPFSGIVGDIPAKVGDFANTSTQLVTLTQNQELEVRIAIPQQKVPSLQTGLPVQLIDDNGGVLQTGRISFIDPNVDPTTQSVQARAVFANSGNALRTNQFVKTRVIWRTRPGVVVPVTAISRLAGRDFVFVAAPFNQSGCTELPPTEFGGPAKVEPDQLVAVQKQIELGKIIGNNQEVLKGVTASDRIVTSGILQLQNCLPITTGQAPKS